MRQYIMIICLFVISLTFAHTSFSQDITLSWDASPTSGVTGYNVYYKAGSMDFPFDGIGSDQGASPVNVGNTLTTTLTGLSDGINYFFTVTAYDDSSNQSTYSNIVSNEWIPALTAPVNGAGNEPVPVTFQWQTAPSSYSVSYTLFYGTNQSDVSSAIVPPAGGSTPRMIPTNPELLILLLLGLTVIALLHMKKLAHFKPQGLTAGLFLLIAGTLTACGGGGGGSDSSGNKAVTPTTPVDSTLYSIDKGSSDYHQAFDLDAGTTYYWKIVATDVNDTNLVYESQVQSFTTETF
jgi:Fibronectin type III domain